MSPFRKRLLVTVCAAAAVLAVPAMALAQNGPPSPPIATVFGKAPGATEGQAVVAFLEKGGTTTHCGTGHVDRDDENDLAYVVDVESSGGRDGCAEDGDTVSLWFIGADGDFGAVANQDVQVSSGAGGIEHNITLSERTNRLTTPNLASNIQ